MERPLYICYITVIRKNQNLSPFYCHNLPLRVRFITFLSKSSITKISIRSSSDEIGKSTIASFISFQKIKYTCLNPGKVVS